MKNPCVDVTILRVRGHNSGTFYHCSSHVVGHRGVARRKVVTGLYNGCVHNHLIFHFFPCVCTILTETKLCKKSTVFKCDNARWKYYLLTICFCFIVQPNNKKKKGDVYDDVYCVEIEDVYVFILSVYSVYYYILLRYDIF